MIRIIWRKGRGYPSLAVVGTGGKGAVMPDSMQPESPGVEGSSRAPISKGRITLWVILTLLFLLLAGTGGVAWYVWHGLQPAPAGEPVRVDIPSGTSAFGVADLLEEKGVIRNAFLFKYYLRYKNEGQNFQAGAYDFAPGMTRDELIAALNDGRRSEERRVGKECRL